MVTLRARKTLDEMGSRRASAGASSAARGYALAALVLSSIVSAGSAVADEPAAKTSSPTGTTGSNANAQEKAERLFKEGLQAHAAGEWEKAHGLMQAAFDIAAEA